VVRGFLDLIEAIVRHATFLDRLNDAAPGIAAALGAAEGLCALLWQSATDVIKEFGQRLVNFVRRTRLLAQNIAREFRVTVSPDGSQAQFAVNLHDQAQLFQPLDIAR
jgi:hypothetical protein